MRPGNADRRNTLPVVAVATHPASDVAADELARHLDAGLRDLVHFVDLADRVSADDLWDKTSALNRRVRDGSCTPPQCWRRGSATPSGCREPPAQTHPLTPLRAQRRPAGQRSPPPSRPAWSSHHPRHPTAGSSPDTQASRRRTPSSAAGRSSAPHDWNPHALETSSTPTAPRLRGLRPRSNSSATTEFSRRATSSGSKRDR